MASSDTTGLIRWFGGVALAVFLAGCSGGADATKKQLTELETEITALRADQDRFEERLEAVELRGAVAAKPRAAGADERPRLKVIRLSPDEESAPAEGPSNGVPAEAEPEPDDPRPVIRGQGDRVIKTGDTGETSKATGAVGAYEAALREIREGRYESGIEAFGRFLRSHPKSPYADNALYWIGEAHYARGEYEPAAQSFSRVLSDYPHGNKVPDSLLKLGLTQKRLGQEKQAEKSFAKLTQRYPATTAARRIPRRATR